MIRRVDSREFEAAQALRRIVAADQATVAPEWMADSGAKVMAQESGRHVELDEAPAIIAAFAAAGVDKLTVVTNDPLVRVTEAYEIGVSEAELIELSDDLIGINFVLVDGFAERCILFTTFDFKLIAGPISFITAVAGEPRAARDAFLEFVADQTGSLRVAALRAAGYMNWVGSS